MEKIQSEDFLRSITSLDDFFLLTLNDFSTESCWLLSLFFTIDSTTAQPKLRLENKALLIFDQKVFDCWSRENRLPDEWLRVDRNSIVIKHRLHLKPRCFADVLQCTSKRRETKWYITMSHENQRCRKLQLCVQLFRAGRQSNCLPALCTNIFSRLVFGLESEAVKKQKKMFWGKWFCDAFNETLRGAIDRSVVLAIQSNKSKFRDAISHILNRKRFSRPFLIYLSLNTSSVRRKLPKMFESLVNRLNDISRFIKTAWLLQARHSAGDENIF